MPEIKSHLPGMFCWADVQTNDVQAAKRFYSELLGWQTEDMPIPEGGVYVMAKLKGKYVAALSPMDPVSQKNNVPPHWTSYVAVKSAEEAVKKAQTIGGKVMVPAMDVMDSGRMAMIQDPTGAIVAVWEPRKHPGAQLVNEPGTLTWNELLTTDVPKARDFYAKLFGWDPKPMNMPTGEYTVFESGGKPAGGLMAIEKSWGKVPPHWVPYFNVADTDGSVDKAKRMTGRVMAPPKDIPTVGRFAMLLDPQGADFALLTPKM
jgi:uncharacterized protein